MAKIPTGLRTFLKAPVTGLKKMGGLASRFIEFAKSSFPRSKNSAKNEIVNKDNFKDLNQRSIEDGNTEPSKKLSLDTQLRSNLQVGLTSADINDYIESDGSISLDKTKEYLEKFQDNILPSLGTAIRNIAYGGSGVGDFDGMLTGIKSFVTLAEKADEAAKPEQSNFKNDLLNVLSNKISEFSDHTLDSRTFRNKTKIYNEINSFVESEQQKIN